jgi:hypothetical protein
MFSVGDDEAFVLGVAKPLGEFSGDDGLAL